MKQGIVVCTWSGGREFADLCLAGLNDLVGKYPIYVVINDAASERLDYSWVDRLTQKYFVILVGVDGREPAAIKSIIESTDLDEFWFIQDSIEVIDTSFIVDTFKMLPGKTVSYSKYFNWYFLAKYQTALLKQIDIQIPETKMGAIKAEHQIQKDYLELVHEGIPVIDSKITYSNSYNYIDQATFSEERLAVIGKYIIKRISLVKENFRVDNISLDEPLYMTDEEVQEWRTHWHVLRRQ